MKTAHLDQLLDLAGYATRELNITLDEWAKVLRQVTVGIDLSPASHESKIVVKAYWGPRVVDLKNNDRVDFSDPANVYLTRMPLYEFCQNDAEVQAANDLLERLSRKASLILSLVESSRDDDE